MGGAIIAGVITFLIVGSITADCVMHNAWSGTAFSAGALAAVWVALPFIKQGQIERYNTLTPVPNRYKMPWKLAFAKVREIISRANYKMGSKWNVATADTTSKHIHATLQFMEEEFTGYEGSSVENIRRKTERVQRFVELDIQFKDDDESCSINLDFHVKTDGMNTYAADFVIDDIKNSIERELGPGTPIGNPAEFTLEAPPWWLLGITALVLLNLLGDVWKMVFNQ